MTAEKFSKPKASSRPYNIRHLIPESIMLSEPETKGNAFDLAATLLVTHE